MSNYKIEYKKLGIMLAVIAVTLAGLYLLLDSEPEADDITSFQLGIDQDEFSSGDTVRILAEDQENEPVEGVEIEVNNESIGSTNANGVAGYRVPEQPEPLQITGEHEDDAAELTIDPEDDSYTIETEDEDTDETEEDTDETEDEDTDDTDDEDTDADETDETDDEDTDTEEDEHETDDRHGIVFEDDLEAGSPATLTLYDNGETVGSETVYIDDEEQGETTTSGTLTFTIPNQEEITVDTGHSEIDEETFSVDYDEEEEEETEEEDLEPLNAMYNYEPSNPVEYTEIEFNASESTGTNIESYNWNSPDTELDENTGETITHEFTSPGTYNIELEIGSGEQGTDTIDGEVEVDEAPEPGINWLQPTQSTYEDTEIETEIEVFNGVEGAEYRIIENQNTIHTSTLSEDGDTTINENIQYSEGEQDIHFELDQAGETHTTDTRTIEFGFQEEDPELNIISPDGTTVETFDEQEDVEFQYEVETLGWMDRIHIELQDSDGDVIREHNHSTSQEQHEYIFEDIPASESGEKYTWTISTEEGEVEESASFDLEIVEPEFEIERVGEQVNNGYEAELEFDVVSDLSAEIDVEIWNEEETIYDFTLETTDDTQATFNPNRDMPESDEYFWDAEMIFEGETRDTTEEGRFETTEVPPDWD